MPENQSHIHVVGLTSDGRLWHTVRRPGGWSAWTDVYQRVSVSWQERVTDVAAVRMLNVPGTSYTEGLYVVLSTVDGELPVLFRDPDTASWQQFTTLPGAPARRVTAALSAKYDLEAPGGSQRLHVAYVTPGGYGVGRGLQLGANTPYISYSLPDQGLLRALSLGFATTALSDPDYPISLAAIRADGRAWFGNGPPGSNLTHVDLESAGAGEVGDLVDLVGTGSGRGDEHFIAVTGDGRIWLASHLTNGSWRTWRDLELTRFVITGPGVYIEGEEVTDVGTFQRAAATTASEGLHLLGVTTNGRLWHQLRPDPWATFRDVELVGVGQDVGYFTAVSAA